MTLACSWAETELSYARLRAWINHSFIIHRLTHPCRYCLMLLRVGQAMRMHYHVGYGVCFLLLLLLLLLLAPASSDMRCSNSRTISE
jgi:hypothetical protein